MKKHTILAAAAGVLAVTATAACIFRLPRRGEGYSPRDDDSS